MRRLVLCLASCLAAATLATAQAPPTLAADEAAVRDVVQRYTQARALNDPKAIEALFTADADQYTSSGEWRRGLPALMKAMVAPAGSSPGVSSITVAAVRFVTPDIAIVDGDYKPGNPTETRALWTTLIVKREARVWRIAAIRNMAPSGQTR